jgi:hypothetical protein
MNTFVLLITLLTPAGDVSLIAEHYPDRPTCEAGRVEAVAAVERKPKGFTVRDSACYPAMQTAKGK